MAHLKSKLRMEKEQMSTPLPHRALKMPPQNPVTSRMAHCQNPKLGMESYVLRLYCLRIKHF